MLMHARTIAATTAGALLAVPVAVLVAAPANADIERHGNCGGGRYELSVDREGGGFEVNVDLDNVAPGSKWKITLRQDGKRYYSERRTADREGDIDVERFRSNTNGSDKFSFRAKRVGGGASCTAAITV